MLVELKLLKRQDLVGVIANALKPVPDQLHIRLDPWSSPSPSDNCQICGISGKIPGNRQRPLTSSAAYQVRSRVIAKYLKRVPDQLHIRLDPGLSPTPSSQCQISCI